MRRLGRGVDNRRDIGAVTGENLVHQRRVADVAVYQGPRPEGRYGTSPPYITVEIVSPDDRYNDLTERLEDYRRWGVGHVWLVDPQRKRLWEYTEAGLLQHASLRLPEFDFEIASEELFKDV